DDWREPGWSATGERAEILARYRAPMWSAVPRALLAAPEHWQKWALYDRPPLVRWGKGAVTLVGDAAHPMLPYLAQGAAMAIEDAAVLAQRLADARHEPARAPRPPEPRPPGARADRGAGGGGAGGVPDARLAATGLSISWADRGRFCARSRSPPSAASGCSRATIGSMAGGRPEAKIASSMPLFATTIAG